MEGLLPGLTDVVEVAYSNDEAWQVLLHLEAHAESLPAHLEVAEVAPHRMPTIMQHLLSQ